MWVGGWLRACVRACVRVGGWVRACVRVGGWLRACVRACVSACVRAYQRKREKSIHPSPGRMCVCEYVCMWVCGCVCVCVRACVRAYQRKREKSTDTDTDRQTQTEAETATEPETHTERQSEKARDACQFPNLTCQIHVKVVPVKPGQYGTCTEYPRLVSINLTVTPEVGSSIGTAVCFLVALRPSYKLEDLRDGSAQATGRAATLR